MTANLYIMTCEVQLVKCQGQSNIANPILSEDAILLHVF